MSGVSKAYAAHVLMPYHIGAAHGASFYGVGSRERMEATTPFDPTSAFHQTPYWMKAEELYGREAQVMMKTRALPDKLAFVTL